MKKKERTVKPRRTEIPKRNIVQRQLQREIGSRCPFCTSEDVSHFDIHHIDDDRTNHAFENLILLCKACHSKFSTGVWEFRKCRDKKDEILKISNYRLLESSPIDSFDYICYGMQESNGRLREEKDDGSIANIKVIDQFNIQITLKQSDGRIWKGELLLKTRNYGELYFIYDSKTEIEVGRRECYIRQIFDGDTREDQFYFKPLTDKKDYGDEFMVRKVKLK